MSNHIIDHSDIKTILPAIEGPVETGHGWIESGLYIMLSIAVSLEKITQAYEFQTTLVEEKKSLLLARKKMGLTQAQMARRAGISRNTYLAIEQGLVENKTVGMLRIVAETAGLELEDLL